MLLCRLFVASGLVCGLLLGPSFVDAQQESKSQSDATIAVPRLRRIVINQHALRDTGNAGGLDDYLDKHLPDRITVETAYDQTKVDEMSKAIEDFWKEQGINVGVRTTLTSIPTAPRYAVLKFEVYRR
jgi:maltose-binding protein MalE